MLLDIAMKLVLGYHEPAKIDKPLLLKCLRRATAVDHLCESKEAKGMSEALKLATDVIVKSSPEMIEEIVQKFTTQELERQSYKEHPLYNSGVPCWSPLEEIITDNFNIHDDDYTSIMSESCRHEKHMFFTRSNIQVYMHPINQSRASIVMIDVSAFGSSQNTRSVTITYEKPWGSDSTGTWATLEAILEIHGTNSIRHLFGQLLGKNTLSLGSEYLSCHVHHGTLPAREVFGPMRLKELKPVSTRDIDEAFRRKGKVPLPLLIKLIANGQFENFMLNGGYQYGEPCQKDLISNPLFLFNNPGFIEQVLIKKEKGGVKIYFNYIEAIFCLNVALENRYLDLNTVESTLKPIYVELSQ
ncbi:hypothetical protein L1D14_07725 [Vibrio tubiashii]|uniref:hypothetical protein n=1 Tax=Vibrio tubiashii TaxID=29498 RepID=UPI001EFE7AFB|nr:hypothetical protein [Vibrio tubiashii]MCG9576128.1 hypothetical protein [Vibrio tubiashii]